MRGDMARRSTDTADAGWSASRRLPPEEPSGPSIGSVRITPIRVFLLLALIGSLAYLAYAVLLVRDTSAIPMLASGAFILGIVFVVLGIAGAMGMNRAGRERRDRDALLLAIGAGIAMVIGLFCFAGGAVLALVLQG
jgi:hypothetical protein